jgi:uncharacterized protein (TIGR03083 family)
MQDQAEEAKAFMIRDLDTAREEIRSLLAEIDPHTEIYPGWTLKELLAHFVGWDEAVTSSLRAHAGGQELAAVAVWGTDYYNAESVATRQPLDYEQVVREWRLARDELKSAIRELPDDRLDMPLIFPWGGMGAAADLVAEFTAHERVHTREVREQLGLA